METCNLIHETQCQLMPCVRLRSRILEPCSEDRGEDQHQHGGIKLADISVDRLEQVR